MVDRNSSNPNSADDQGGEERPRGPLGILFAPDRFVWEEARRLVSDKNVRVESLALCAAQDPVLVIELLRVANAMYFSGGRAAITSAKTAIVRLGSEVIVNLLEEIKERPQLEEREVANWFEVHRNRCKRTAIISRMFAELVAKTLIEDCHSAGLLMFVGEMLAVAHFRELYVSLAEELSRTGVKYRLSQENSFDVEKMGVKYLHRNGIPEGLLFAVDLDSQPRQQDRAIIKPVVWAASELVDAFDSNRWEKLAPGKTIPAKSALRLLKITDQQYLKLYERASEYLFSSKMLEEKRKKESFESPRDHTDFTGVASQPKTLDQSEIQALLKSSTKESGGTQTPQGGIDISSSRKERGEETRIIESPKSDIKSTFEQFNLNSIINGPAKVARKDKPVTMVAPPPLTSSKGRKAVEAIAGAMANAETGEDLLTNLLSMLVDKGPFHRAAIIVVSNDRKQAIVVCSRGPIGNGQRLSLDDPLSPLAQCFSKVQSFGSTSSANSPFGSRSYALAPIDADHETPVALYADCGDEGSIAFDARRVFRTVVDLLNEKLPTLPGGIPVELVQ